MGKNWTGRCANHDKTKKVEMDWPYLEPEKEKENTTRIAMKWNPQGKRKQGRPKQSWRRTVIKELESIGKTWGEAEKIAINRVRWKAMLEPLCLRRGKED